LKDDLAWVEEVSPSIQKLQQAVHEFHVYITTNQAFLVNYGDRYRNGETISSAFVESTVNEVISKRFAKKQQMRWTKEGAQQLLQVRILVLNNTLRETFSRENPMGCAMKFSSAIIGLESVLCNSLVSIRLSYF
jgi:hypothetical protein